MTVTRTRTAAAKPAAKPAAKTVAKPAAKPVKETQPEENERIPGSLAGNITMEPELRFTQSGRAVASIRVAVSDRVKNDETGEWEDTEPEFYTISVWGDQAERVVNCFIKGDRIVATGFFQDRTWTDNEGDERVTTEFTARDIGPSMLFKDALIKRPQRSKAK